VSDLALSPLQPVWARDLWLVRAIQRLRPVLAATGLPLPAGVTVQAGAPSVLPGEATPPFGECWPSGTRDEGVPHIVINESLTDVVTILSVCVHELIHASDDCQSGHGPWFQTWAIAVGLKGPFPSTHPGTRLRRRLRSIARTLGRYPDATSGYCLSPAGSLLS
jgi:hypothetical protein